MRQGLFMIVAAGLAALALEGCAGTPADYAAMPPEQGKALVQDGSGRKIDCVPFARDHSDVKIYGDAVTWWDQAAGHYAREEEPSPGAIMVLHDYAGPKHGHVAVVRSVVNGREIRVDHANWLNDGAVYLNDPVVDVSPDNDWSRIRVWNIPNNAWGARIYPVQGFIGPGRGNTPEDRAVAQGGAMGTVALTGQ